MTFCTIPEQRPLASIRRLGDSLLVERTSSRSARVAFSATASDPAIHRGFRLPRGKTRCRSRRRTTRRQWRSRARRLSPAAGIENSTVLEQRRVAAPTLTLPRRAAIFTDFPMLHAGREPCRPWAPACAGVDRTRGAHEKSVVSRPLPSRTVGEIIAYRAVINPTSSIWMLLIRSLTGTIVNPLLYGTSNFFAASTGAVSQR
jgi:hypothetical protein